MQQYVLMSTRRELLWSDAPKQIQEYGESVDFSDPPPKGLCYIIWKKSNTAPFWRKWPCSIAFSSLLQSWWRVSAGPG